MTDRRRNWVRWAVAALIGTALAAAAAVSCEIDLGESMSGPLTFVVESAGGDFGTESDPLPFTNDSMTLRLNIQALGQDGRPSGVSGRVHVTLGPTGELAKGESPWVTLKNGVAKDVALEVRRVHGKSFIWIEDTGADKDHPGSYATGLSPAIWVKNPTIRNVQETDNIVSDALMGDFVEIDTKDRTLVVTGVTNDGFYVTDVSEEDGLYSAIYVFSFSRPNGVEEGSRLSQLSGIAGEFFGFTELSFPSWVVAENGLEFPPPVTISAEMLDDGMLMEPYESRLVEAFDVTVCPITDDYQTYDQWAVALPGGSCSRNEGTINVVSVGAAPEYDPTQHVGETIAHVVGNLRYHQSADPSWMIYPRDNNDLNADG